MIMFMIIIIYGRFPKFHRVLLGRDPGTLKSDIVSKKVHNWFVRIWDSQIENSKIEIMETDRHWWYAARRHLQELLAWLCLWLLWLLVLVLLWVYSIISHYCYYYYYYDWVIYIIDNIDDDDDAKTNDKTNNTTSNNHTDANNMNTYYYYYYYYYYYD